MDAGNNTSSGNSAQVTPQVSTRDAQAPIKLKQSMNLMIWLLNYSMKWMLMLQRVIVYRVRIKEDLKLDPSGRAPTRTPSTSTGQVPLSSSFRGGVVNPGVSKRRPAASMNFATASASSRGVSSAPRTQATAAQMTSEMRYLSVFRAKNKLKNGSKSWNKLKEIKRM